MNKITIELCAEDRARLDNIFKALEAIVGHGLALDPKEAAAPTEEEPKVEAPKPAPVEEPKQAEPAKPEPVEAPAEPTPAPAAAPKVSTEELQSKVVQLVRTGKKDEARAIVTEYAKSVSEIPEDKRAEVLSRLTALEG